jgi:hypothetical protein
VRAVLIAILICVPATARADEFDGPSPVIATVSLDLGATSISETATDGAKAIGSSVGFSGALLYKLTPRWSTGIAFALSTSGHDTDEADHLAVYTAGVASIGGRVELGRFGATATAGYAFGRRSVRARSTADEISSVRQHGFGVAATGFVRVKAGPVSFEAGPYVELDEMWSKTDEPSTTFDEKGMRRQSASVGAMLQVAFGTGPIR